MQTFLFGSTPSYDWAVGNIQENLETALRNHGAQLCNTSEMNIIVGYEAFRQIDKLYEIVDKGAVAVKVGMSAPLQIATPDGTYGGSVLVHCIGFDEKSELYRALHEDLDKLTSQYPAPKKIR